MAHLNTQIGIPTHVFQFECSNGPFFDELGHEPLRICNDFEHVDKSDE